MNIGNNNIEQTVEIQLFIKRSNIRKLKYLQSFSEKILDMMIENLYKTFKEGEK
jgi:hypothetical protein